MAHQLVGNPKVFDSNTAAVLNGTFGLILLQWIDDNADIADNSNLIFTINGVTCEATIQRIAAPDSSAVLWQIGPFNPPMPCRDFTLSTMTAGNVHVWVS